MENIFIDSDKLEKGKCYVATFESNPSWDSIFYSKGNLELSARLFINEQSFENKFVKKWIMDNNPKFRLATQEEKEWIDECISQGKYLPNGHPDKIAPVSNGFKKGDYIVLLKKDDNSWLRYNHCYVHNGKDPDIFYTDKCSRNEVTSLHTITFSSNLWRYATDEEIAEYNRIGAPYDVNFLKNITNEKVKNEMKKDIFAVGNSIASLNPPDREIQCYLDANATNPFSMKYNLTAYGSRTISDVSDTCFHVSGFIKGWFKKEDVLQAESYSNGSFKIGDIVKVVYKAKYGERGWFNNWVGSMSTGFTSEIFDIDKYNGIKLKDGYWYPSFSLELVKSEQILPKLSKGVRVIVKKELDKDSDGFYYKESDRFKRIHGVEGTIFCTDKWIEVDNKIYWEIEGRENYVRESCLVTLEDNKKSSSKASDMKTIPADLWEMLVILGFTTPGKIVFGYEINGGENFDYNEKYDIIHMTYAGGKRLVIYNKGEWAELHEGKTEAPATKALKEKEQGDNPYRFEVVWKTYETPIVIKEEKEAKKATKNLLNRKFNDTLFDQKIEIKRRKK